MPGRWLVPVQALEESLPWKHRARSLDTHGLEWDSHHEAVGVSQWKAWRLHTNCWLMHPFCVCFPDEYSYDYLICNGPEGTDFTMADSQELRMLRQEFFKMYLKIEDSNQESSFSLANMVHASLPLEWGINDLTSSSCCLLRLSYSAGAGVGISRV